MLQQCKPPELTSSDVSKLDEVLEPFVPELISKTINIEIVKKHLTEDLTKVSASRLRLIQLVKFILIQPELVLVSSSIARNPFMMNIILKNSSEKTLVAAFELSDQFDKSVLSNFDTVAKIERGMIRNITQASGK